MACTCGPGQQCDPLKPGCWGYESPRDRENAESLAASDATWTAEPMGERTGVGLNMLDRLACRLGIWALRRLYGECATDVRDDFPDEPDLQCAGCDATRMIHRLQELVNDV